jgi:hypothetical protein
LHVFLLVDRVLFFFLYNYYNRRYTGVLVPRVDGSVLGIYHELEAPMGYGNARIHKSIARFVDEPQQA